MALPIEGGGARVRDLVGSQGSGRAYEVFSSVVLEMLDSGLDSKETDRFLLLAQVMAGLLEPDGDGVEEVALADLVGEEAAAEVMEFLGTQEAMDEGLVVEQNISEDWLGVRLVQEIVLEIYPDLDVFNDDKQVEAYLLGIVEELKAAGVEEELMRQVGEERLFEEAVIECLLSELEMELAGPEEEVEPGEIEWDVDDGAAGKGPDLVNLYVNEINATPLLTAEEEVRLAKEIERGIEAEGELVGGVSLKPERQAKLEAAVKKGEEARDHFIKANTRLVMSIARRKMGLGVPFLDLIQEGNLGLMRAVRKFDYRRGCKFSTLATWWIRQAIGRALANQGRTIRIPVHMNDRIRKMYAIANELRQNLGREPTNREIAAEMDIEPKTVESMTQASQEILALERPVGDDGDSELGDFIPDDRLQEVDEQVNLNLARVVIDKVLAELSDKERQILRLRFGFTDGEFHTLNEVGERFGLSRERIRQIEQGALKKLRHPRRSRPLRGFLDGDNISKRTSGGKTGSAEKTARVEEVRSKFSQKYGNESLGQWLVRGELWSRDNDGLERIGIDRLRQVIFFRGERQVGEVLQAWGGTRGSVCGKLMRISDGNEVLSFSWEEVLSLLAFVQENYPDRLVTHFSQDEWEGFRLSQVA